jgi:hypothetical protein
VTNLWMEALDNFSPVMWANSVRHCEDLISGDWRREMGTYTVENIPPIIITLADSDNGNLSFSSDSSDDENGSPSKNVNLETTTENRLEEAAFSLFVVVVCSFLLFST